MDLKEQVICHHLDVRKGREEWCNYNDVIIQSKLREKVWNDET